MATRSPLKPEINSFSAEEGTTGSYANVRFLPANPQLLTLGRGWVSRTAANELAPLVGGAGPGSFKPHAEKYVE